MSKEFFEAVKMLEAEKGISAEYLYEKISAAIVVAAKRNYNGKDIVHCDIDPEKQRIKVYVTKNVVEEIEDEDTDLTLEQAVENVDNIMYEQKQAFHKEDDKKAEDAK